MKHFSTIWLEGDPGVAGEFACSLLEQREGALKARDTGEENLSHLLSLVSLPAIKCKLLGFKTATSTGACHLAMAELKQALELDLE